MIPGIQSKLPDVGTTIFTTMSALANEYKAINLGQGFPDYHMPEELTSLVTKAMQDGYNQYVPMQGYLPLREAIAQKVYALYNAETDPHTSVTITPGGTYAIYTALTAILKPGDEVIVFQPCYDSYIPNIVLNGAKPVLVDLSFPGYRIDWQEVRKKITPHTRMIMLNSPHNPTGTVLHPEDLQELAAIVKNTSLLILSDEVYEHLIFDEIPHQSVLRVPELRERSFVCFSFGKLYHCTGWKLGYCIAPPALTEEFRKVHQFNCFSCHSPSQIALSAYLKNPETYNSLGKMMQSKRDHFASLMESTKFDPLPSHGSYFQLYQYHRISDESDVDFCKRITKEYGVAAIPVSVFYQGSTDHGVIRFCFAKKETTLEEAARRLQKI